MVTDSDTRSWSDLALPPGELLVEELAAIGMTQQELAVRMDRPAQVISEIISAKKAVTFDTAVALEKVLSIPAHVWINLEATYKLTQARTRDRNELSKQEGWLKEFPVAEMGKRGWVPLHTDKTEKVRALLRFLGVASFSAWRQTVLGFRISEGSKVSAGALAVWLRKGELEGREIETERYDENQLREALATIRSMTTDAPKDFVPKMTQLCALAGVAVVFIPELPKSGANGAARWLTPDKALIQMSLRWHWHDIFWFSFFHEACHILRHRVHDIFIDGIDRDAEAEAEADAFARDTLIPPSEWEWFLGANPRSEAAVREFATKVGVAPGIVVGRMHREKVIPYNHLAGLKMRLVWKNQ